MQDELTIYGAGLAGLMAARILRPFFRTRVREAQPSLPNNHHALLRFRSAAVGEATGIPFRKVPVQKAIWYDGRLSATSDLRLNNLYSRKVLGHAVPRSIINLEPGERYIAPPDFIAQLASGVEVECGAPLTLTELVDNHPPSISTVPMPVMMKMVGWPLPAGGFHSLSIETVTMELEEVDLYQTIYYPDPKWPFYRVSLSGNRLQAERIVVASEEPEVSDKQRWFILAEHCLEHFGLQGVVVGACRRHMQPYGKLLPCDETERRAFITGLTDTYGVYSLGRFATWRQLLLDNLVPDIQLIQRMILDRDKYATRLHLSRKA